MGSVQSNPNARTNPGPVNNQAGYRRYPIFPALFFIIGLTLILVGILAFQDFINVSMISSGSFFIIISCVLCAFYFVAKNNTSNSTGFPVSQPQPTAVYTVTSNTNQSIPATYPPGHYPPPVNNSPPQYQAPSYATSPPAYDSVFTQGQQGTQYGMGENKYY